MDIKDLIKVTGNEFASIVDDGIEGGDVKGWVDSGSYAFNALLSGDIYGGFPRNKIVLIGSSPGVGKCARGSQSIDVYFKTQEDLDAFLAL